MLANIQLDYKDLGREIQLRRKQLNLTQEQLAERAGISRSHLSAIEAPNTIRPFSLEILFQIAHALNVPAWNLLQC